MPNSASGNSASSAEKRTNQVLEALRVQLRQCRAKNGCSPKQIFGQLLRGCKSRNLALQLRAALKRAVAEGLVKLLAGRYLVLVPPAVSKSRKSRKLKKASKRKAKRANKQQPAKSCEEERPK